MCQYIECRSTGVVKSCGRSDLPRRAAQWVSRRSEGGPPPLPPSFLSGLFTVRSIHNRKTTVRHSFAAQEKETSLFFFFFWPDEHTTVSKKGGQGEQQTHSEWTKKWEPQGCEVLLVVREAQVVWMRTLQRSATQLSGETAESPPSATTEALQRAAASAAISASSRSCSALCLFSWCLAASARAASAAATALSRFRSTHSRSSPASPTPSALYHCTDNYCTTPLHVLE